jgi:hypothetical protein
MHMALHTMLRAFGGAALLVPSLQLLCRQLQFLGNTSAARVPVQLLLKSSPYWCAPCPMMLLGKQASKQASKQTSLVSVFECSNCAVAMQVQESGPVCVVRSAPVMGTCGQWPPVLQCSPGQMRLP